MDLNTLKILVVDDNPINVKLLGRTLTNNNFQVISASSGKEAIASAEKDNPDLILLDVLMPGLDGYETCKVLKQTEVTQHIPVIFLSAKNETVDKAKGLALGASDYLTKPFDPVEIIARIHSHMAIRKDVRELQKKNRLLEEQLVKATGKEEQNSSSDLLQNIVSLKNINYHNSNKYLRISARVKFAEPPATTVFMPVFLDEQNFIFLLSGGFDKNYNTSLVQLLLQQFVQGYFKGQRERSFSEKELYNTFDLILNTFSPDIYNAAFTLSLGHINAAKPEFTSFTIHQAPPIILNERNQPVHAEFLPVFYESKYAKIIKATKLKLRPKSTLVNYLSGKDLTPRSTMDELCLPHFTEEKTNVKESVEQAFSELPESEKDQLLFAVSLV